MPNFLVELEPREGKKQVSMANTENVRNGAERFDGWKEISNYLRCNIRSCLRWEKDLGLPVIRINKESKRSKVIAYKADIDRWLAREKENESGGVLAEKRKVPLAKISLIFAALLVLAGAAYWLFISSPPSGPAYSKLKGQTLVFFDTHDRELWDAEIDSSSDQTRFYEYPPATDNEGIFLRKWGRTNVALADIDHDDKKEVACLLNHEDPLKRSLALIDHNGEKLWEKPLEYKEKYLTANPIHDFRPFKVGFDDINSDGVPEILALWGHVRDFPSVFEIRSIKGERLFQYDHTGIIQFFVVSHDLGNGTGKEILLGGTNNLLGGDAVLIVLDCANLKSGLGPPYSIPADLRSKESELEAFVPAPVQSAAQKHYFRFKHNEMSDAQPAKWIYVTEIQASPEGLVIQIQYGLLYFHFDSDKRLLDVRMGADARRAYQELLIRKKASLTLEDFLRAAEKDVLAWDGAGWIPVAKTSR